MTGADWKQLGETLMEFWRALGWQSVAAVAGFALFWKFLDSWGKKPK